MQAENAPSDILRAVKELRGEIAVLVLSTLPPAVPCIYMHVFPSAQGKQSSIESGDCHASVALQRRTGIGDGATENVLPYAGIHREEHGVPDKDHREVWTGG